MRPSPYLRGCRGAIERSRIDVPKGESLRDPLRRRRFTGGSRSIDGDDDVPLRRH
jgi:hypothetical protein